MMLRDDVKSYAPRISQGVRKLAQKPSYLNQKYC